MLSGLCSGSDKLWLLTTCQTRSSDQARQTGTGLQGQAGSGSGRTRQVRTGAQARVGVRPGQATGTGQVCPVRAGSPVAGARAGQAPDQAVNNWPNWWLTGRHFSFRPCQLREQAAGSGLFRDWSSGPAGSNRPGTDRARQTGGPGSRPGTARTGQAFRARTRPASFPGLHWAC